jgi:DNA-binding response OmpR family regulator
MNKPSALIIEDDPKLGVIFQVALQQAGFDVEVDQSGKHFSRRLAGSPPALIILDIHLPYASGSDIFEEIMSNGDWSQATVIVTTADLIRAKPLEGRADYVLIKPVSIARILNIVASHWPDLAASEVPRNTDDQN